MRKIRAASESLGKGEEYLRDLLDYEIRGAARFRRFTTLVMVTGAGSRLQENLMREVFRKSDEIVRFADSKLVILMRETDPNAALKAVDRFKRFCCEEPAFQTSVASFPSDGCYAMDLMRVLEERFQKCGLQNTESGSEVLQ
jgi:hypothetical protein